MNPMTYLAFTLMSILIQFCLMDLTFDSIKLGKGVTSTNRSLKKDSNEMVKRITQKPHALYYRTEAARNGQTKTVYPNSSITESTFSTTDATSTELDLFYEDNSTMIDAVTAETFLTSTEFDNVTEITFLYKTSTVKPLVEKKTKKQGKCSCDLLYQMCDINCCCDFDCTEKERLFFKNCGGAYGDDTELKVKPNYECSDNVVDNLFCIVKTNLPEKRDIHSEADSSIINKVYKWHKLDKPESSTEIKKTVYSTGDPILLLKNGKLLYVDRPIPSTNNYCKGKKAIGFLVNEAIKCNVKLKDLHAMQVLKMAQETHIVTFTNDYNSTNLNCSTLLCANWKIVVCDFEDCQNYSKELHEPSCTETVCSKIPYKIEYIFYINESGIVESIVRLHVKDVSTMLQLIQQDIHVGFYMSNDTNRIIKYSGNPGYIHGLPVIASSLESNHTRHFYNSTGEDNHILLPHNENGICVLNRMTNNKLEFGRNKRVNCRLILARSKFKNATDACTKIQERIYIFLRLNGDIFISPLGKPTAHEWVLLTKANNIIYGEYQATESKLICYNLMTRISFTMVYVDRGRAGKENTIVSASVEGSPRNLSLYNEQNSVVLSVDVRFIDASGPAMRVYAGAPGLSIHLPKNFFLPFH